MGRLLGIDYGKKRTGLAVSDPLQLIATPLTTVPTARLLPFLDEYVRREEVERIVVGWPRQTDGQESENAARIRPFLGRLRKVIPNLPIALYDERYTSILAQRTLLQAGKSPRTLNQDKGLVDKVSACIILQDYMRAASLHSTTPPEGTDAK